MNFIFTALTLKFLLNFCECRPKGWQNYEGKEYLSQAGNCHEPLKLRKNLFRKKNTNTGNEKIYATLNSSYNKNMFGLRSMTNLMKRPNYIDNPNYHQVYLAQSFIDSVHDIFKRGTESSVLTDHILKSEKQGNNKKYKKSPAVDIGNLNSMTMLTGLVSGSEMESDNSDHNGLNALYTSQGDVGRDSFGKNNIKVHCVKAGREEIICTHGDFTYKISLPEQFMNQDTVEGLVSSIYNNIELGRHSPFAVPFGTPYTGGKQLQSNAVHDESLQISKPYQNGNKTSSIPNLPYPFNYLGNLVQSSGILTQPESKNQVIKLSIPIESQSSFLNSSNPHPIDLHENNSAHLLGFPVPHAKFQSVNQDGHASSVADFIGGQIVPINITDFAYKTPLGQNSLLNYSLGGQNSGSSGFLNCFNPHQENMPPTSINFSPSKLNEANVSSVNSPNVGYFSRWYAKRSSLPFSAPNDSNPINLYLVRNKLQLPPPLQRLKRTSFDWCTRTRTPVTRKPSVNEGKKGKCVIPKKICSCRTKPTCPCFVTTTIPPCQSTCPPLQPDLPIPPPRCPPYQLPCERCDETTICGQKQTTGKQSTQQCPTQCTQQCTTQCTQQYPTQCTEKRTQQCTEELSEQ